MKPARCQHGRVVPAYPAGASAAYSARVERPGWLAFAPRPKFGEVRGMRGTPVSAFGSLLSDETFNPPPTGPGSSPLNFPRVPFWKVELPQTYRLRSPQIQHGPLTASGAAPNLNFHYVRANSGRWLPASPSPGCSSTTSSRKPPDFPGVENGRAAISRGLATPSTCRQSPTSNALISPPSAHSFRPELAPWKHR